MKKSVYKSDAQYNPQEQQDKPLLKPLDWAEWKKNLSDINQEAIKLPAGSDMQKYIEDNNFEWLAPYNKLRFRLNEPYEFRHHPNSLKYQVVITKAEVSPQSFIHDAIMIINLFSNSGQINIYQNHIGDIILNATCMDKAIIYKCTFLQVYHPLIETCVEMRFLSSMVLPDMMQSNFLLDPEKKQIEGLIDLIEDSFILDNQGVTLWNYSIHGNSKFEPSQIIGFVELIGPAVLNKWISCFTKDFCEKYLYLIYNIRLNIETCITYVDNVERFMSTQSNKSILIEEEFMSVSNLQNLGMNNNRGQDCYNRVVRCRYQTITKLKRSLQEYSSQCNNRFKKHKDFIEQKLLDRQPIKYQQALKTLTTLDKFADVTVEMTDLDHFKSEKSTLLNDLNLESKELGKYFMSIHISDSSNCTRYNKLNTNSIIRQKDLEAFQCPTKNIQSTTVTNPYPSNLLLSHNALINLTDTIQSSINNCYYNEYDQIPRILPQEYCHEESKQSGADDQMN